MPHRRKTILNRFAVGHGSPTLHNQIRRPIKIKKKILFILIILSVLTLCYSCEKKEPEAQPDPAKIMAKIAAEFPECGEKNIKYESGNKAKELSDQTAAEKYSEDKNKPVDLSKIEKYSVVSEPDAEIGIFKLYDKVNASYVKDMANTRISKMQNSNISEINNNAEVRSYGNYVYYVSHEQKDKIFEIIENMLRSV